MKWYVLNHDFNSDKIISFNIFDSTSFKQEVDKLLEEFVTFDDFKEKLDGVLKYSFMSRAEYEMMCNGLFYGHKVYKIDIYTQMKPNLDTLARYVIGEYNRKVAEGLFTGSLFEKSDMAGLAEMIKECGESDDTREA